MNKFVLKFVLYSDLDILQTVLFTVTQILTEENGFNLLDTTHCLPSIFRQYIKILQEKIFLFKVGNNVPKTSKYQIFKKLRKPISQFLITNLTQFLITNLTQFLILNYHFYAILSRFQLICIFFSNSFALRGRVGRRKK